MPSNLPLKLTQAQTVDMKNRVLEIERDYTARGLDPAVVTMELAMVCARYAVNAGILDQHRLPQEPHDPISPPQPSPPVSGPPDLGRQPTGATDDDGG